jgi:hypothetical protein
MFSAPEPHFCWLSFALLHKKKEKKSYINIFQRERIMPTFFHHRRVISQLKRERRVESGPYSKGDRCGLCGAVFSEKGSTPMAPYRCLQCQCYMCESCSEVMLEPAETRLCRMCVRDRKTTKNFASGGATESSSNAKAVAAENLPKRVVPRTSLPSVPHETFEVEFIPPSKASRQPSLKSLIDQGHVYLDAAAMRSCWFFRLDKWPYKSFHQA